MWNRAAILFRVIPKDESYDIMKITWGKRDGKWNIAGPKYPEVSGDGSPFEIHEEGIELWEDQINDFYEDYPNRKGHFDNVIETMSLLSDSAKKKIVQYHNKISNNS
jgi:hypothetical protein